MARPILLAIGVVVLLVVVAMFVRRSEYPDGSLLLQERTWITEQVLPDLEEALGEVVPGTTTAGELLASVGEPMARMDGDGIEVWIYMTCSAQASEQMLLGLIRTRSGTSRSTSQMPVALQQGVVVHTPSSPLKNAVQRRWWRALESSCHQEDSHGAWATQG